MAHDRGEWNDRIDNKTLLRLRKAHDFRGQHDPRLVKLLNDLVHDLVRARADREKYWLGMHPERDVAKDVLLRYHGLRS